MLVVARTAADLARAAAAGAADGEEAREEARDEGLEGGQRGARDGNVDLGRGPDGGANAVAGRVGGDGDLVEALEADNTRDADTESRELACCNAFDHVAVVGSTHKLPKAKTKMRPIFWLRGNCSCLRSGMGNAKTMMSVVMFRAELENQKASWFMQWPSIVLSQKYATGMHMKKEPQSVQTP